MEGEKTEKAAASETQGEGKQQQQQQQPTEQEQHRDVTAADERMRYIQQHALAYYPQQLSQAAYQYGYHQYPHPQQWAMTHPPVYG